MKYIQKDAIIKGIIVGLSMFVLGFGVLYIIYFNFATDNTLPGLFDYYASTIGDGFCLPLLAFSLTCFTENNIKYINNTSKRHVIIALVGGVIGVIVQLSWVMNENISLNWSIPRAHHFNIAGWWHAFFFVFVFSTFAFLFSRLLDVTQSKMEMIWTDEILIILIVFSGVLFLLLHFFDDYPSFITSGWGCIIISILIQYSLVFLCKRKNDLRFKSVIAIGIICSIGFFFELIVEYNGNIYYALLGSFSMTFCSKLEPEKLIHFLITETAICVTSYGIFYYLSSDVDFVSKFLITVCLTVLLLIYDQGLLKKENDSFIIVLTAIFIIISSSSKEIFGSNVIAFVFVTIIYAFFVREIKSFFKKIVEAERFKNKECIRDEAFFSIKGKSYIKITMCILCIIIVVVSLLIQLGNRNENTIGTGIVYIEYYVGLIACLGIILITTILSTLYKKRVNSIFWVAILFVMYSFVLFSEIISIFNCYNYDYDIAKILIWAFSFFANSGAAVMVSYGFISNTRIIRGLKCEKNIKICGVFMGIFCFLISYSASFKIAFMPTWFGLLSSTLNVILSVLVFPVFAGFLFRTEYKKSLVVPNSPIGGVAQDGGMIFLIIVFASFLPNIYCSFVSLNTTNQSNVLNELLGAMTLILTAFFPVTFCIKNNRQHLIRQYKVAVKSPSNMERWQVLRNRIVHQSRQTCFALLPYIVLIVISRYVKDFCSKEVETGNLKEYSRVIWNEYIETDDYQSEIDYDEK